MTTPELDQLVTELKAAFPAEWASGALYNLGVFNCRRKNNLSTGPWSEHAWGNAIDVGVKAWATASGRALGDRVAKWGRGHAAETFWQVPAHYNHVHLTAAPRRNPDNRQVPPCAVGGSEMELIKGIQRALNAAGFKGKNGAALTVDGVWGANTEYAFTTAVTQAGTAIQEVSVTR